MNQNTNPPPDKTGIQENATPDSVRRSALNSLARRDHSRQEIKQKLKAKGYQLEEIEPILIELEQKGLINDGRFAENYVYWRSRKGYGPNRIIMELEVRGIAPDVIAEHLKITDNAWFTEAHKVWQKQFKSRQPKDFKDRAKQMRFLQYRGFTREQINSVFLGVEDENMGGQNDAG